MAIIKRRQFMYAFGGALVPWALAAGAQEQSRVPKVGVLWHAGSASGEAPYFGSLIEGFRDLGYGEGSIVLEHRFPDENPALFKSLAAELVSLKPDVLIAVSAAAPYVEEATKTIPIVFMYVPDPLGNHLVQSIRRPGGNATGLSNFSLELCGKRLEYLKEVVPGLARVALLVNPNAKVSNLYIEQSNAAAPQLGLSTQAFEARSLSDLEAAFDAMVKAGMQAVVVNAESLFYQGKDKIAELQITRNLPACAWVKEVAEAGALLSYGTDQRAIARRVAVYVDRILKGEKPADMPVEQPARFELIVNKRTAKTLGLGIPPQLLATADDVIG